MHTTLVTVLGLVGAAFLIWATLRYDLSTAVATCVGLWLSRRVTRRGPGRRPAHRGRRTSPRARAQA